MDTMREWADTCARSGLPSGELLAIARKDACHECCCAAACE